MNSKTSPYSPVSSYPLPLGFNGRLAWVYRWFSGRPLNGHRYTDSTGFRYGTRALDVSGHATPFQLLPGYKRFLYARLPIMLAAPYVLAAFTWTAWTLVWTLVMSSWPVWTFARWTRVRVLRREVIEPLSAGLSTVLRTKRVDGMGHLWVDVPRDIRSNPKAIVSVKLPLDWIGQDGDKAAVSKVVQDKLAMSDLVPTWTLSGQSPRVCFHLLARPPDTVSFDRGVRDMSTWTAVDSIMVGYGPQDRLEDFSLQLESPHMMIAGGSGCGKSTFIAWIVGQLMRRGFGVACLDAKYVSHMWLRRVPGVLYASETEELHDALMWLDEELTRRARFASLGNSPDLLKPLVVILEEMNTAAGRLRAWWSRNKPQGEKGMSPALVALANLASMGREMRVHILMAGQSLSAKSTGGPEARESFGGRALARATANQWRMLAPQIKPAPVKHGKPGRWHIVVGDTCREYQVPFIDLKDSEAVAELIAWATGGEPGWDVVAAMQGAATAPELDVSDSPVVAAAPVGIDLRAYAADVKMSYQSLIDWRNRRSDFPTEVATGANRTKLYDRTELDQFVAGRLREPVEVEE